MNATLTNDERIVKSWEYAKVKGLILTKGTSNLTVTNKRLIVTTQTKRSLSRDDMPIENITSISANYYSNFSLPLVLLGVLLCITIVLLPIGVNLIRLGTGTSLIVVVGNMPSEPVITTTSIRRLKRRRFKAKVNRALAQEICEQLSTIIFVDLNKNY